MLQDSFLAEDTVHDAFVHIAKTWISFSCHDSLCRKCNLFIRKQPLAVFRRRDLVLHFKDPVEIAGICISYRIDDILYRYFRVFQQLTGFCQLNILNQPGKAFACIFTEDPRHLPLKVIVS